MSLSAEHNPIAFLDVRRHRLLHPFTNVGNGYRFTFSEDPTDVDLPRTLVELRMCALSAAIREKPHWYNKFREQTIRAKWIEEIQQQQQELHESLRLSENMINYVMTELEAYAALRDDNTGIEPGPYERIWRSDGLVSADTKSELLAAVASLESVPDSQKDWHPKSDGKVLDLVHPSLYPIVYGRTVSTTGELLEPREDDTVDPRFMSNRYQWLPSDFSVAADGTVSLESPYINNVHPEDHAAAQKVILKILERAIPMFEWVLSDLERRKQLPSRIDLKGNDCPQCVWGEEGSPPITRDMWNAMRQKIRTYERKPDEPPVNYYRVFQFQYYDKATKTWPDSKPTYDGGLDAMKKTISLRGTKMQVIVKLANIVLTPDKPEYMGGTWHVEGMNNEAIVATFIYYYDCENITESTLSFRNAVDAPQYHRQGDEYCMHYLYGIDPDARCVQEVGKMVTKQDRCIAFPNIYQHLVSPFRLADTTKPGHRKILVFFLVDPSIRIPSASDVAPQQMSWFRRAVSGTVLWDRLPTELQDVIIAHTGLMTEEEANAYRLDLMQERTAFVDVVDKQRFGTEFNMCEH